MIYGNQTAQNSIIRFFDHIQESTDSLSFLLATGTSHLGKSTILKTHIEKILGTYFHQDFLYVQDFGEQIGKEHSLKVDSSTGEREKMLSKEYHYEDIGMRQINDRISKTPVGTYKVVLIENIERMTRSATNAFLKTCEEPPANVILLATSSSSELLLDTVVSRAFLVRFHPLSAEQMKTFFVQQQPNISDHDQETFALISQGRPGLGIQLIKNPDHPLLQLRNDRHQMYTQQNTLLTQRYHLFQEIQTSGLLTLFLDILIGFYDIHKIYGSIPAILKIKRYIQANVNKESVLLLLAKVSQDSTKE